MVARSRGARFHRENIGPAVRAFLPINAASAIIANGALRDVARWLRFRDEEAYLDKLETEGKKIFKRAKK
jgi:hypothetical protein